MAAATLLGRQFRRFHPDQPFFIVMADELRQIPADGGESVLIPLGAIELPGEHVFPYQHAIPALCDAVKPFCSRHLLRFDNIDQLLYLDAEVGVFGPLDAAWEALACANIVLTPHTNQPLATSAIPSDLSLLQCGLFNSGFVAMKDAPTTLEFLDWWCERVYTVHPGKVADDARLDQKWLDLAPIYFGGVHILRDVAYNVGYLNLHERTLTASEMGYLVNGRPLAFFNFRGFDPDCPDRLSVHQPRNASTDLPVLARLCTDYAQELEHLETPSVELQVPACLTLGNGIPMSRLASAVVMRCVQNRIGFPAPGRDPDAFCEFLTTPNTAVFGFDVAPVVSALLAARPDVEAAFPDARHDKHDQGIRDWLETCGGEENLGLLLQKFGLNLRRNSRLQDALAIYSRRHDLQQAFPELFADEESFAGYGRWLDTYGRDEDGVDDDILFAYLAAPAGFRRVLQQFFSDPKLLNEFKELYDSNTIGRFLAAHRAEAGAHSSIDSDDLIAFDAFATARRDELLLAFLRYNPRTRSCIGGGPSILNLDKIESFLRGHGAVHAMPMVVGTLLEGRWITPGSQVRGIDEGVTQAPPVQASALAGLEENLLLAREIAEKYVPGIEQSKWGDWCQRALQARRSPVQPGINLHGPLHDATGMGEWARSCARTLLVAGIPHRCVPFPSRFPTPETLSGSALPALFGEVDDSFDVNLVVANADSVAGVREWLPEHVFQDRCNVGCWIWETEASPRRFGAAANGFHAIISPSDYSVDSIRANVGIPVYKVHCALDFDFLATASPDRASFDLPDEAVLFGFFLDAKSVLERKNPKGLIKAFRAAFGTRKDVGLVLKVNSAEPGSLEYDSLKQLCHGLNIFWIERTLSLKDTLGLMASLDVYVSLHRSEGFGLTMAEAMALGKPVIATGYSGNLEFMEEGSAALVDFNVLTTTRAHGPYPAGSRWAEPSIEHCAQWMGTLVDVEVRRRLGMAGQARVRELLDPKKIARQMDEALKRIRSDWYGRKQPG